MIEKLKQAKFTPEVFIKSFANLRKVIETDDIPAMMVEARFEGEGDYAAILNMSAVKINSYRVVDTIWEDINQSDISTDLIVELVESVVKHLEESNACEYRLPVPLGIKPVRSGVMFSLDLRVIEKGLDDASI